MNALKVASIVVALAVVGTSASALAQNDAQGLVVREGYYKDTVAGGAVEKRYTGLGQFEVASIQFPSKGKLSKNISIWYPKDRKISKYPAVVFTNASNLRVSQYAPVLEHLVSWGFIGIGNDDTAAGDGASTSETLDFLLAANADPDNPLYGKVDTAHIGVTGGSQGGPGAINAATRFPNSGNIASVFVVSTPQPDVIKALFNGQMIKTDWAYDTSKLRVPYLAVAGTGDVDAKLIAPLSSVRSSYEAVPKGVPAGIAMRNDADHEQMLPLSDGYMTAWFRFTLMDDRNAARAFKGKKPEIARNKNWRDVELKNINQR